MLTVSVTKDYLLIPVKLRAPKLLLTVFSAEDREKKLYEWETPFPRARTASSGCPTAKHVCITSTIPSA